MEKEMKREDEKGRIKRAKNIRDEDGNIRQNKRNSKRKKKEF